MWLLEDPYLAVINKRAYSQFGIQIFGQKLGITMRWCEDEMV